MATLQVRSAEVSVVKKKALEDAQLMQATVQEKCKRTGQEVPPYTLQELIGKGSYGRVYKAQALKTKQLVAVKIIDIDESDRLNPKMSDMYSEFLKEISALKLLSESGARNVNHFLDALPVAQTMWMITEYCAGGSVATLMRPTAPGGLQEKWIIPILREVAEAVYWVHRQGIIHRDIKCANVLVTEAGGVQLCDFGVAGVIETKFDKRSTVIGTPHWMAPELFDAATSYGTEVDIWAFGAMVFEIASGLPPNVHNASSLSQLGMVLKQHTPRLEGAKYSAQLRDLVAFCLTDDPRQRPSIEQVQHHPYIFGTADAYPTDTLAMLVRGYKLWEAQGGNRKSLFAAGGAQPPPPLPSSNLPSSGDDPANPSNLANDEWNFSTTLDFDRTVLDNPDPRAVYDVYGTQVDYDGGPGGPGGPGNANSGTTRKKGRRRQPPPHLPAVKAPLERVFDPNTISNYDENSRQRYGQPPPPPTATPAPGPPPPAPSTSDLPLRDDSLHATLRESLIDLDASQIGFGEPSHFDMETIRAGGGGAPRISVEYDDSNDYGVGGDEYHRPPLSDPADHLANNRRTQDWKFPAMTTPASANPEMSRFPFPFHEDGSRSAAASPPPSSRRHQQPTRSTAATNNNSISSISSMNSFSNFSFPSHPNAEPISYDLAPPPPSTQNDNRMSVSSLIDLDESLPDPLPGSTSSMLSRPSTAHSDAPSVSGSDMGSMANPFDLERHASMYQPFSSAGGGVREPSIYVSDDYAAAVGAAVVGVGPTLMVNDGEGDQEGLMVHGGGDERPQRRAIESYLNAAGVYAGDEYVENHREAHFPGGDHSQFAPVGIAYSTDDFPHAEEQQQQQPLQAQDLHQHDLSQQPHHHHHQPEDDGLPPVPGPPSPHIMQGLGTRDEVRDEMKRLLDSFQQHLTFTNTYVTGLPVRKAGGGLRVETSVED